jgi:hypothetical protein
LKLEKELCSLSPAPAPLTLTGYVTARSIREVTGAGLKGSPMLFREYALEFCDAARAFWSHHRPCAVYAKASLDRVIKENTPSKVNVTSTWTLGQRVRPLLCLGLGADEASFYDWLFWRADVEYGHVWYDYSKQCLVLDSGKPRAGTTQEFVFGAITQTTSYQLTLAPPPREAVQLLNSRAGATSKWAVEQPNALDGVRRDYLIHTPLSAEAEGRQALEKNRYATGEFEVHIDCDAYPEMYLAPGTLVTLAGEFSDKLFVSGKTLRTTEMHIRGVATHQEPEFDIENDATEYEVQYALDLESVSDPRWRGPTYRTPRYPLRVEGKIVSALGLPTDRAYTIYADTDTDTGDTYKINLPLWNATIAIPMTPDFLPGQLYLPAFKDSRVFVALEFDSARIERFLDWGKDVTLPLASQGNHLLFGKNDASETSIKHWYVDNSPELVIRRAHSGDLGTVTVKEGTLTLELTEQDGGLGLGTVVSVEPQAQMAKAESEQKAELAVADLQDATSGAHTKLKSQVQQAATGLRQQAEQLSSQVNAKSKAISGALADVGTTIDAQAEQAGQVFADARKQLEDLLK